MKGERKEDLSVIYYQGNPGRSSSLWCGDGGGGWGGWRVDIREAILDNQAEAECGLGIRVSNPQKDLVRNHGKMFRFGVYFVLVCVSFVCVNKTI